MIPAVRSFAAVSWLRILVGLVASRPGQEQLDRCVVLFRFVGVDACRLGDSPAFDDLEPPGLDEFTFGQNDAALHDEWMAQIFGSSPLERSIVEIVADYRAAQQAYLDQL